MSAISAVPGLEILLGKLPINSAGFFHGAGCNVAEDEPGTTPAKLAEVANEFFLLIGVVVVHLLFCLLARVFHNLKLMIKSGLKLPQGRSGVEPKANKRCVSEKFGRTLG